MPFPFFKSASTRRKTDLLEPDSNQNRKKSMSKKALHEHKERDLQFYTQLAHGGSTKRINAFMSLKDLYSKLAIELEIDIHKIMFCTLNTPKVDMRHLLSGLVVYNDFIFVHVQGISRQVTIKKEEKAIGITITDNSMGCCFVKRIKQGSVAERSGHIHVGDQIVKLADQILLGKRHYDVAQRLKDTPVGDVMRLVLVEPKQGFDSNLCPRRTANPTAATTTTTDPGLQDGRATVRIKSDGTVQEGITCNWLEHAKLKIDDLLESYMGIRDLELACTILETSDENPDKDGFSAALDDLLGDFAFPTDFVDNAWDIIESERKKGETEK